jgi:hypothetical protein
VDVVMAELLLRPEELDAVSRSLTPDWEDVPAKRDDECDEDDDSELSDFPAVLALLEDADSSDVLAVLEDDDVVEDVDRDAVLAALEDEDGRTVLVLFEDGGD